MAGTTLSMADTVALPGTSVHIPRLGFGVYQVHRDIAVQVCAAALDAGYRHIDSAQLYRNEEQVGQAVHISQLRRSDVFLTTKIGLRKGSAEDTYKSMLESVRKIAGDGGYVDLFLLHSPNVKGGPNGRKELWMGLERLLDEGKTRSIGVSNYTIDHLEELKGYTKAWPPQINQIELHPWCQHRELVAYCEKEGIVVEAYSPLARGTKMEEPLVKEISERLSKSPAQVLVRYALQKGWVVLPKSEKAERIKENADVFDFGLGKEDMMALDGLDQGLEGMIAPQNMGYGHRESRETSL